MKCGLCLPHCPTYGLELLESDSPRGRIALMQGLATGELAVSDGVIQHLDRCLGCRACETACPAEVPYGRLLDVARAELRDRQVEPVLSWRLFARAIQSRLAIRVVAFLIVSFKALSLHRLLVLITPSASRLQRILELTPERVFLSSLASEYPANPGSEKKGAVSLFTGCLGEALEYDTLKSSIQVLNDIGYDVRVPRGQGCCGAIHQHGGYPREARKLAEKNIEAFAGDDAVVAVSTGCLASLRDYTDIVQDSKTTENTADFASRCVDISTFLQQQELPQKSGSREGIRVALHTPCTQRIRSADAQSARALTERQVGSCAVLGNGQCCGAAGTYMLDQPDISRALAEQYDVDVAPVLLTSNIGCRLQLEALCRRRGIKATIAHPISLLAREDVAHSAVTGNDKHGL